jgi:RNA polymerase sigma-B factor
MTPHWHARAGSKRLAPTRARGAVQPLRSRGRAGARDDHRAILAIRAPASARYEGRGEPIEDLVQAASVGLIKAVDRYSPERGDAFPAYARAVILGELRRHFRDKTWRVHVPRPMKERATRVGRADAELRAASGSAKPEAIAKSLGIAPEEVAEARRALEAYWPWSLDATYTAPDGDPIALAEVIGVRDSD